jgi:hypothetical protein
LIPSALTKILDFVTAVTGLEYKRVISTFGVADHYLCITPHVLVAVAADQGVVAAMGITGHLHRVANQGNRPVRVTNRRDVQYVVASMRMARHYLRIAHDHVICVLLRPDEQAVVATTGIARHAIRIAIGQNGPDGSNVHCIVAANGMITEITTGIAVKRHAVFELRIDNVITAMRVTGHVFARIAVECNETFRVTVRDCVIATHGMALHVPASVAVDRESALKRRKLKRIVASRCVP